MLKESSFAIFEYELVDAQLIDDLANYLDNKAKDIFDYFEVKIPEDKIKIKIIPTKKEFDDIYLRKWGHSAENWAIGFYDNIKNGITYLSINDYKNTSHKFEPHEYNLAIIHYRKTIVHEFVHYVNDLFKLKHNCGYTEKYLSEGIATYLSNQKDNMDFKFNFSLEEIYNNKGCYNAWYMLTKTLIENYNKEFVFNLIKSNRKAREFLEKELYNKTQRQYDNNK